MLIEYRKKTFRKKTGALGAALLTSALATPVANAGLVISFAETGDDVTMTVAGSFATLPEPASNPEEVYTGRFIGVRDSTVLYVGGEVYNDPDREPTSGVSFDAITFVFATDLGFSASTPSSFLNPTGDFNFGISNNGVAIDSNYTLGAQLSATDILADASFDSMGLTSGNYSATIQGSTETVEIRVGTGEGSGGGDSNEVPEPATGSMALLGMTGLAWWVRRRRAD